MMVIRKVDELKLLAPIEIIRALSRNPQIHLGFIRTWLLEGIISDEAALEENLNLVKGYDEEERDLATEIHDLKTR